MRDGLMLSDHGRSVYRVTILSSEREGKRYEYIVTNAEMSKILTAFQSSPHNVGETEFITEIKLLLGFVLEDQMPTNSQSAHE